ncbi:MAG TPA: Gfo/Idh/MocA family oxidoreductase [Vicinamibacterales bacterium]|jgi:predicted dehydrogenase|nr:Gfo/Idh/MocA family oxidoreductase [Vicinamibacterales bacterium]
MSDQRLTWGVLGTAKIAVQKVIPAIQLAASCQVTAIASRDWRKADDVARRLGIPRAYGSYEALLADPDIDIVYIPLPNHLHVPWATRAAEAGKHVLCEKPIASNAAQARELLGVRDRTGVRIQEAFMIRTHPQWLGSKAIVDAGELGDVGAMSGFFSYYNVDPTNVRNIAELGGGGLLDIGCYLVNTARFIFGTEPLRVAATVDVDHRFGVDRLSSMVLDFGGRHAIGTCSTQLQYYQRVHIIGTRGRIDIEIPFNAPVDRPCRIAIDRTGDVHGGGVEYLEFEICNQFTLQAEQFADAIIHGRPQPAPLEDALGNAACIDAIVASSISGCWQVPAV